ncbi:hypothetical protein CGH81_24140 [Vibrio parahaemolyticus]|nr:hypothetical protein CGH81_24140 [Vibrio parahaemolyticus]
MADHTSEITVHFLMAGNKGAMRTFSQFLSKNGAFYLNSIPALLSIFTGKYGLQLNKSVAFKILFA